MIKEALLLSDAFKHLYSWYHRPRSVWNPRFSRYGYPTTTWPKPCPPAVSNREAVGDYVRDQNLTPKDKIRWRKGLEYVTPTFSWHQKEMGSVDGLETPVKYFEKYFTLDVFQDMATYTNIYAVSQHSRFSSYYTTGNESVCRIPHYDGQYAVPPSTHKTWNIADSWQYASKYLAARVNCSSRKLDYYQTRTLTVHGAKRMNNAKRINIDDTNACMCSGKSNTAKHGRETTYISSWEAP